MSVRGPCFHLASVTCDNCRDLAYAAPRIPVDAAVVLREDFRPDTEAARETVERTRAMLADWVPFSRREGRQEIVCDGTCPPEKCCPECANPWWEGAAVLGGLMGMAFAIRDREWDKRWVAACKAEARRIMQVWHPEGDE